MTIEITPQMEERIRRLTAEDQPFSEPGEVLRRALALVEREAAVARFRHSLRWEDYVADIRRNRYTPELSQQLADDARSEPRPHLASPITPLRLDISDQAQLDLKAVWRWADRRFTDKIAARYVACLESAFEMLRLSPDSAELDDGEPDGLLRYRFGDHTIYFTIRRNAIRLLRIVLTRDDPLRPPAKAASQDE